MSVMASGTVGIVLKQPVPQKLIDIIRKECNIQFNDLYGHEDFDGNIRLDDVIDSLELLNPYIKSGTISYWSDEGDGCAEFHDGVWIEEWEQKYYPSELPTTEISSTERVTEILGYLSFDELKKLKEHLTEKEMKLYNIDFLEYKKGLNK